MISRKLLFLTFLLNTCLMLPVQAQYKTGSIYSAARGGDLEYVQSFLPHVKNENELNTILAAAVAGDQIKVIDFLLKNGADIDHLSSWNTNLLINAIAHKNYEAAKFLIRKGANPNAAGFKREDHGMMLAWNWTPLMCAAWTGQLDLIKLLIKKGADPHFEGWSFSKNEIETCADIAAYSGHLKVLQFLLKRKVTLHDETIFKVVRGGHLEVLQFLIKQGYDVNQFGPSQSKNLLMEAAWWGHADIVQFLLESGADVNFKGKNKYTPLMEAISNISEDFPNQYAVIKILIENGADINLPDRNLISPLMLAVSKNDTRVIDLLIINNAQ